MAEIDPKLGELIKKARIEQRLTQEEVAELVGCHSQYYKNLENAKGMPSLSMFRKIMNVLNIPSSEYINPNQNQGSSIYKSLLNLLNQCDEYKLSVLHATAEALLADAPDKNNHKEKK